MKEGDLIRVSGYNHTKWEDCAERIYLFTNKDGEFVCVDDSYKSEYRAKGIYRVMAWPFIIEKTESKYTPHNQFSFPEGRSVKHDEWNGYYLIHSFGPNDVVVRNQFYTYKELAEHFTFRDGTRCRREVE